MNDEVQYIKYVKIPVNGGRGYYLLTPEYFATCTITQFKSVLKEIRYNMYLFSNNEEIKKVLYFMQQGIVNELYFYNNYSGYENKKNSLKRKLEILDKERRTFYKCMKMNVEVQH